MKRSKRFKKGRQLACALSIALALALLFALGAAPQALAQGSASIVSSIRGHNLLTVISRRYEQKPGEFPMFPKPMVSTGFTLNERTLIWNALAVAQDRIADPRVVTCIDRYTTNGYGRELHPGALVEGMGAFATAHPKLRPGQGRQLDARHRGGLQFLYINRFEIKPADKGITLGRAPINIGVYDHDLSIALNTYALKSDRTDLIAGVIVHEMLHNWGFRHSPSSDIEVLKKDVPGNFVYEAGWCVERAGSGKIPGRFGRLDPRYPDVPSKPGLGGGVWVE